LVALAENPVLDEVLTALFTCEKTVCVGFSFNSDLSMFKRAYKTMKFFQNFAHFVDVQSEFGRLIPEKKGVGLAKVVDALFGQVVCKGEQMGNWERRPLRLSQQHYGALDAVSLVHILEKLEQLAKEQKVKGVVESALPLNLD